MLKSMLFSNNVSANDQDDFEQRFSKDMLHDLNLDQLIEQISISNQTKLVERIMSTPLQNYEDIIYRQQIFIDLENPVLFEAVKELSTCLERVDEQVRTLSKYVYEEQQDAVFLDIMQDYCQGIQNFTRVISSIDVKSLGLLEMKSFFEDYIENGRFVSINKDSESLKDELSQIQYSMIIDGYQVKVMKNNDKTDFNTKLKSLFANFIERDTLKGYCRLINNGINLNAVEYDILSCIKKLYPKVFIMLKDFKDQYFNYKNSEVEKFHEEIQFYIRYLQYINPLREKGIPFCYPKEVDHIDQSVLYEGCDLGLANKQCNNNKNIIFNDFTCKKDEKIFVVTGPNQGGKTTYARMIGQIHYLFLLGVPVPARRAELIRCKSIFTHFEHEEIAYNDYGKLQDDLMRMHDIYEHLTDHCLVIINEMLSSTSYDDAVQIGEKIIQKLTDFESINLYVTFVDRLASLTEKVVSLVSVIDTNEHDLRTFRIARKEADGNVYATTLANKYDLSYSKIIDRFTVKR